MKIRSLYDGERVRVGLSCDPKKGRTKGSFKKEADINTIMAKYRRTGVLPDLNRVRAVYGDADQVGSYHEAMNRVVVAKEAFAALPAQVRAECAEDPSVFLSRLGDKEWAERHGLRVPPKVEKPAAVLPNSSTTPATPNT